MIRDYSHKTDPVLKQTYQSAESSLSQPHNPHPTHTNNIRIIAVPYGSLISPMALLKSGWLWRKSSVLKRWKLNWCDLWIDGSFVFYKSESRKDYETRVSLKTTCVNVKSGLECEGVSPPETHPRENLLMVYLKDGSTLTLCANSEDEALAWKLTLLEAKRNPVFTYNPYDDTYQTVPVDSHNAVYIMPGNGCGGTQHVWVHRDSYDDGFGEQIALGLLAGMAAGAAMRSLLWMPFWFC